MRYPPLDIQPTVIYSGRSRYDADTDTVYVDIRPGAVAPHIAEMHELGHWYGVHTGMIPKYLTTRKDEITAELYVWKYAAHQLRERGSWGDFEKEVAARSLAGHGICWNNYKDLERLVESL